MDPFNRFFYSPKCGYIIKMRPIVFKKKMSKFRNGFVDVFAISGFYVAPLLTHTYMVL